MKKYLFILSLFFSVNCYAFDFKTLFEGDVIALGRCSFLGKMYPCVAIEKQDSTIYLVLQDDEEKTVAVYSVKEWKPNYKQEEMTLLWSKGMT